MATLKLGPTGKIALCGSGALRVSCCPADCCLYPWPDPDGDIGGPYYPDTYLPDTIVVTIPAGSAVFTRSGYVFSGTLDGIASDIFPLTGDPLTPFWQGSGAASEFTSPCLIDSVGSTMVEDEFPDTLTMSFAGYDTIVTRISNCEWTGLDLCGNTWRVWYGDLGGEGGVDYKWSADAFQFDFGSGIDCPNSEGFAPSQKDDPQSSPIGTYDNGPVTIIVA